MYGHCGGFAIIAGLRHLCFAVVDTLGVVHSVA